MTKLQAYYRLARMMFAYGNNVSGKDMMHKAWALPAWDADRVLSEDGTHWEAADVS